MAAHDVRTCLGLLAGLIAGPASADDLAAARQQFLTSCGVCHTVEQGAAPRQGPNLLGVYGRAAGALPDFNYSAPLRPAAGAGPRRRSIRGWRTRRPRIPARP